jgi:thioredoxin-like negative regulator of GroEL
MSTVYNKEGFSSLISDKRGVLFYFSTLSCSVGEALEPKVQSLLSEKYPKIVFCSIDMNASPELCGLNQVFVEPTILLFLDGKESLRMSRNIGVNQLENSLSRLYQLAFE